MMINSSLCFIPVRVPFGEPRAVHCLFWKGGAFFIARLLIVIIQRKVKKSIGQKEKVEKFFRACIMKWKRRYISIADERA
ncbi:MAG: hypothetical protein ACFN1I_08095 [Selenomonas artemidis]